MNRLDKNIPVSRMMAVLLFTCGAFPATAATLTFTLTPGTAIAGAAGSTEGWGYELTNTTPDWVETVNLTADIFSNGTPTSLFDFPVIAPGATVTVPFSTTASATCTTPDCGLFEFTWNAGVPVGSVNSGTFTISSELFATDPLTDPTAIDLGAGTDATASYSVTVSGTPEPAPSLLLLASAGLLAATRLSRKLRVR